MRRKKLVHNFIYYCMGLWIMLTIFRYSMIQNRVLLSYGYTGISIILRAIIAVCCTLIFMDDSSKERWKVLVYLVISGVCFWVSGDITFADVFLIPAFLNEIDHVKVKKILFLAVSIPFLIVSIGAAIGLIEPWHVNGRLYMGFCNPDGVSWIIMIISIFMIDYIWKKNQIAATVFTIIDIAFLILGPQGKTAAAVLLLICFFLVITDVWERFHEKRITESLFFRTVCYILPIVVCTMVYLITLIEPLQQFFLNFGQPFYNRFYFGDVILKNFGVSVWGNPVSFPLSIEKSVIYGINEELTPDCLYIKLPVKYGIVPTVYFVYMLYRSIAGYIKRKDTVFLIVCMGLCIYSAMDRILLLLPFTFIYILGLPDIHEEGLTV